MKRRGYDIGRVVDLIFEYWLGRMKDSELEEYRHMKETTGLDKYAREFEDREWIKNALEEPDISASNRHSAKPGYRRPRPANTHLHAGRSIHCTGLVVLLSVTGKNKPIVRRGTESGYRLFQL